MSINGLPLAGWDETSTWGFDGDTYYAQLTPNGISDANGPQVWIGQMYVIVDLPDLVDAIATATGAPADEVFRAMNGPPAGP